MRIYCNCDTGDQKAMTKITVHYGKPDKKLIEKQEREFLAGRKPKRKADRKAK